MLPTVVYFKPLLPLTHPLFDITNDDRIRIQTCQSNLSQAQLFKVRRAFFPKEMFGVGSAWHFSTINKCVGFRFGLFYSTSQPNLNSTRSNSMHSTNLPIRDKTQSGPGNSRFDLIFSTWLINGLGSCWSNAFLVYPTRPIDTDTPLGRAQNGPSWFSQFRALTYPMTIIVK